MRRAPLPCSQVVQLAGFTVKGREWIANGFVSALINVLTFKVYANMTRFEWAYPSGTEHHINQWISGQTMVLATVIMSMVYLNSETRSRVGEPGKPPPPHSCASHVHVKRVCFYECVCRCPRVPSPTCALLGVG